MEHGESVFYAQSYLEAHAVAAMRAGVHPKVVSERLGHTRVGFTLDTYSHLLPSMQREAADRINDVFDRDTLQLRYSSVEKKSGQKIEKP